ncbi:MAG: acetyl-CoA carboxylase biotin carboxyl carrier protein subunit [Marinoscillum sp.]
MKLKVEVNDQDVFDLETKERKMLLNGTPTNYTITKTGASEFLMQFNNRVYNLILTEQKDNHMEVLINGHTVHLNVKDHIAQILEKLGMDVISEELINEIKAPMPGAIIDVMVQEGDEIQEGDTLLILEAMKMENIIKSPIAAQVVKIHIKKGENVEKNQTLISF